MPGEYDRRRHWDYAGQGRGIDPEVSTGYEGSGYGSDFDMEGAGGYESRGGSHFARGGGTRLEREYRDYPAHYGRELLDWETLGKDRRSTGRAEQDVGPRAFNEGSRRPRAFRGVGPKGWTRSDDSILHDVCEALQDADVDVSAVSVDVTDGFVTLSGEIEDRWAKRYVEDVAYAVRGVRDVRNRIEISQ